jgi:hypothetical protein
LKASRSPVQASSWNALEVTLPWLLAKVAEKLTPAIRKEATLMLEHKKK